MIFNFYNSAKNTKKKEIINSVGIIHALIENHENSFAGIQEFKLNALGYPGNETTRQYFKDLVSFSKTICSFRYRKNTVFEGMYGFVGKEHFHLVNPSCGIYYPYHLQYLKTQSTIIGNADNQYSRANTMNYLHGNK